MSPSLKYLTSLPASDADLTYSSAIAAQKLLSSVVPRIITMFLLIKPHFSFCIHVMGALAACPMSNKRRWLSARSEQQRQQAQSDSASTICAYYGFTG